jgi:transcriptional regulator with XRE-family HTH domain
MLGDPSFPEQVREARRRTALATLLATKRVERGMSQAEVAARMGKAASTVSRLEASDDSSLRLGHIAAYARALDMKLSFRLADGELPVTERIKQYVYAIKRSLDELCEIAVGVKDDQEIMQGIRNFYGEVLINFLDRFAESHGTLMGIEGDTVRLDELPGVPRSDDRAEADDAHPGSIESSAGRLIEA